MRSRYQLSIDNRIRNGNFIIERLLFLKAFLEALIKLFGNEMLIKINVCFQFFLIQTYFAKWGILLLRVLLLKSWVLYVKYHLPDVIFYRRLHCCSIRLSLLLSRYIHGTRIDHSIISIVIVLGPWRVVQSLLSLSVNRCFNYIM